MTSPFDDPDGRFLVLRNDEGRYSLWPDFADVPPGWSVVRPAGTRESSLDYVERHWSELRPRDAAWHGTEPMARTRTVDDARPGGATC